MYTHQKHTKIPRGIRNNNPGNIEYNPSIYWQGQTGWDKNGYCIFSHAVYGIRAMFIILTHYMTTHNLHTIYGLISRWAPPENNPTRDYARYVADQCGIGEYEPIHPLSMLIVIVQAMIHFENGRCPYTNQLIRQAYYQALNSFTTTKGDYTP